MAVAPLLGLAHRVLPLDQECRRKERGDDDGREVALQVQHRAPVGHAVDGEGAEAVRGVPVADEAEDREAEGRGAQPEAQRRPDEERRAKIDERRDEPRDHRARAEDIVGGHHEARVEHEQLRQARTPQLERFLPAVAAPREDERRGEQHAEHRRDEGDRPHLAKRAARVHVGETRVEDRHRGHQRPHADEERGDAPNGVHLNARAGEPQESRGHEQRLGGVHRHGRGDLLPGRVQVEADGEGRDQHQAEVGGPTPHGRDEQHAEGDPVRRPDEQGQARLQGQAGRVGGQRVVDDAEGDVGERLPHRNGGREAGDRGRFGAHLHSLIEFYGVRR